MDPIRLKYEQMKIADPGAAQAFAQANGLQVEELSTMDKLKAGGLSKIREVIGAPAPSPVNMRKSPASGVDSVIDQTFEAGEVKPVNDTPDAVRDRVMKSVQEALLRRAAQTGSVQKQEQEIPTKKKKKTETYSAFEE